jgi:hypothetical protein
MEYGEEQRRIWSDFCGHTKWNLEKFKQRQQFCLATVVSARGSFRLTENIQEAEEGRRALLIMLFLLVLRL